mmetsp:Transcript_28705/g.77819  ORF Transcript_28705/g.77819 Transcript_28705/m.77819 type:complete len:101 (-) Transcript_28705:443-745(-)
MIQRNAEITAGGRREKQIYRSTAHEHSSSGRQQPHVKESLPQLHWWPSQQHDLPQPSKRSALQPPGKLSAMQSVPPDGSTLPVRFRKAGTSFRSHAGHFL